MAGLPLQNVALTLPEGTEFPGSPQALLVLIAQYMAITGAETFIGVAYGDTEPDADSRDLWWARTDGSGNAIGWYAWGGASWEPLPIAIPSGATGSRPSSPPDGTLFFDTSINTQLIYYSGSWHTADGSPGDVKFVTGLTLAGVLTQNPGWSHYTDGIGRVLAGAAADGSDAEDAVGANSLTLTEDQMPEHTHEDLVVTASEADSGDTGGLVIVAAAQNIGQKTITNSQTGPKGGSDPVDMRQSTRLLFSLVKD